MKQYTLEELKQSPNTIMKFFVLQGKAEVGMIDDGYKFYSKVSKYKRIKGKTFTRMFLKEMTVFNNRIK